ncbi:MAG: TIGR00296 family protein [Thaumarchaeota archaeon]|nr:TIGR00296 family protein [Nitrososphaerota archaeon]
MLLTEEEGTILVRLARSTVDNFVKEAGTPEEEKWDAEFLFEERGAFVTLKKLDGELRGCIGFPYPVKRLGDAVVEASISAAAHDPRFPPVLPDELDGLLVEVSALTRPQKIVYRSPKELPAMVRVGTDGLIVSAAGAGGLLLPQVATEYHMGPEEFLSQTCVKAGLMPDAWLTDRVTVQRFQAEVFGEGSPRGEVKRELD